MHGGKGWLGAWSLSLLDLKGDEFMFVGTGCPFALESER